MPVIDRVPQATEAVPVQEVQEFSGEETDTNFAIVTKGIKPKLRGIPDVIATAIAAPAAALLIVYARPGEATLAAVIYGITLVLLFAISATYHTPHWPLPMRRLWRKLDHSAIYVLIAGCYTPVFLVVLHQSSGWMLPVVWTLSVLGFVKSFVWEKSPRWLNTVVYVGMGYIILLYIRELHAAAGTSNLLLWATGGVFYSIGALIYMRRKPNPWAGVFGYHETFHVFVMVAGACHYAAYWRVLT